MKKYFIRNMKNNTTSSKVTKITKNQDREKSTKDMEKIKNFIHRI